MSPASQLQFLGAASGSRSLVETASARVLVDCGLLPGETVLRGRARALFPVAPGTLDAVVLTHAHLDHSGYLPALVRDGFVGRIYATRGTTELCGILLPRSGRLLEGEANGARRTGSARHAGRRPLYREADVDATLRAFHPVPLGTPFEPAPGVTARLTSAGHVSGAAQVTIELPEAVVHFSGDLGRVSDPSTHAPEPPPAADILVVESTSRERRHADADEILTWLRSAPRAPATTFVTHGEPAAADALRRRIQTELGWNARVPEIREIVELGA